MRRIILLFVVGALMTVVTATAAFAQELSDGLPDRPEINGTNSAEVLLGSSANDVIRGYGGGDYLDGFGADDELRGGGDLLIGQTGSDFILGGKGGDYIVTGYAYFQVPQNAPASPDFVAAGPGNDIIDAADRAGSPDTVYCGLGIDVVYAGVEDFVAPAGSEYVYRYEGL